MKLRQAEWSYKILQTVFTLSFDTLLWYAYSLLKVRWPLKGTWIYYQYKGWPEIRIRPEMWLVQTGLLVQQSKAGSGSQQQVTRSCVIVCVCVFTCVYAIPILNLTLWEGAGPSPLLDTCSSWALAALTIETSDFPLMRLQLVTALYPKKDPLSVVLPPLPFELHIYRGGTITM